MMKASGRFNFVGNVESSHIFSGKVADVIVCDGFTGNVILKMAEGLYRINNALGGNNNKFWEAMNYEHVGGTPVLGVGCSGHHRARLFLAPRDPEHDSLHGTYREGRSDGETPACVQRLNLQQTLLH